MKRDLSLTGLLERMHIAVRQADFTALPALIIETEALLNTLTLSDAATLARLKEKARRNAACLTAAARGVRSARRRLDEVRNGTGLVTYDDAGNRKGLDSQGGMAKRV
jgi:hypothetical protein